MFVVIFNFPKLGIATSEARNALIGHYISLSYFVASGLDDNVDGLIRNLLILTVNKVKAE